MPGISRKQPHVNQMCQALRARRAAGARGHNQRGLPPGRSAMQLGQDWERPGAGGEVDKKLYVHKV